MNRGTYTKLFAVILISLANFWIWKVLSHSLLLGLLLISISILLVFKVRVITIVLLILLSGSLIKTNFDAGLINVSPLERNQYANRYEYYAQGLGSIYKNRIGLFLNYKLFPYFSKFERNLAYNLDPNLYFFANHPRERAGVSEFEKFSPIFLPLFIIGMGYLLIGGFGFLMLYFILALFISIFISPGYYLGPILIFPFIVSVIYTGLSKILLKKYEK